MGIDQTPRLPAGRELYLPGRGQTFVRSAGPHDGPTLLLLHGWTVTADLNWFTAYKDLADRYRVVAIDHRGHGRGIRPRQPFRLVDCADDAVAAADALGIDSFVPVGYSMGGPIALEIWRRHRRRVDGLVLGATFAHVPITPRGRTRLRALGMAGRGIRAVPGRLRQAGFERLLNQQTAGRDLGQWVLDEIRSCDPRLLLQAGGEIGRFDARPWLGQIDVPTAVLTMERDTIVPPRRQRELAAGVPGARSWPLEADHDAIVMRHRAVVPTLLQACDHAVREAALVTD